MTSSTLKGPNIKEHFPSCTACGKKIDVSTEILETDDNKEAFKNVRRFFSMEPHAKARLCITCVDEWTIAPIDENVDPEERLRLPTNLAVINIGLNNASTTLIPIECVEAATLGRTRGIKIECRPWVQIPYGNGELMCRSKTVKNGTPYAQFDIAGFKVNEIGNGTKLKIYVNRITDDKIQKSITQEIFRRGLVENAREIAFW